MSEFVIINHRTPRAVANLSPHLSGRVRQSDMAELGATVIAFMSLAGVIRPLYAAVSALQDVPSEVIFFRHQLGSLQCIVTEIEHLGERVPTDLFSQRLRSELGHVRTPLQQDVATLQKLLTKAAGALPAINEDRLPSTPVSPSRQRFLSTPTSCATPRPTTCQAYETCSPLERRR
jgi:hypothetical protein